MHGQIVEKLIPARPAKLNLYADDGTAGGIHYATVEVDGDVTVHDRAVYDREMLDDHLNQRR